MITPIVSAPHLPPTAAIAGNPISQMLMMSALNRDFFSILEKTFKTYGDIFIVDMPGIHQTLLCHPDHIHEVTTRQADKFQKDDTYKDPQKGLAKFLGGGLLTSNGDFWKRQRKLMSPVFHTRRIASYGQIMSAETEAIVAAWRGKQTVDVDAEMMRATLDIVAKSLFSADMQHEDMGKIGDAMTVLQHFSGDQMTSLLPSWLPLPARFREERAIRDLDDVVYRLIRQHRDQPSDNGDLLTMLLDARDDEGVGMTDKQIRDEVVTLFLAGHETTANTLNWTWVLLAQHPAIEAKLHAELDQVLGGHNPQFEDLRSLPYTEQVIKEAMRIYPPVYSYGREAIEDVQIGGYDIAKGSVVTLINWITQRDERWFPNPDVFVPERWTPEFEKALPKGAYTPFGGGPRICIGQSFAMMEAVILLAGMAQNYRLRLIGEAPEPEALLTLRPKGGLKMHLEAR